jgi:hypothetical protein
MYHGEVSQGHPPPGTLRRSIITKFIKEQSTYYRRVYFVTVRHGKKYQKQGKKGNLSQDAYYWKWVEFGHYYVARASGKTARAPRRRDAVAAGKFVPAQPFMRPAFQAKRQTAVDAITEKLRANIERHATEFKAGQSTKSAYR